MPKRSEKRDTAKAEYIAKKKKGEEVSLRALAGELGVSYQTLRNWKAADKWEEALPKKKRGGQPGNQNSKGKRNAAGSHDGAPPGNKNAEKDGAYSTVFFDMLSAEELKITESVPLGGREALEHEMKILKFREHKILAKIAAYESQPEDALFVSSLLDMRTPGGRGKDKKDGANQTMGIVKSITFDNGTEFAAAEELERSCINKHLPRTKVYFCHPYSSWERGTNENTNGMIRRRFPKGTNFAAVTNAQIVQAENWINNYPRKILGYKSSEIVFRECLRELGIAA